LIADGADTILAEAQRGTLEPRTLEP
jgi:hypothetical protein